jgi:hypothetical protein
MVKKMNMVLEPSQPEFSEPLSEKKTSSITVIALIVLVAVIGIVLIFLLTQNNLFAPKPSPAVLKGIKAGDKMADVEQKLGAPEEKLTEKNRIMYTYPSSDSLFKNIVVSKQGSEEVLLVGEFLENADAKLSDYTAKYGNYDKEYYNNWGQGSRTYLFSKAGILVTVAGGVVQDIVYFDPADLNEVMDFFSNSLYEESPYIM